MTRIAPVVVPLVVLLSCCATPPPPLGRNPEFFPYENSRQHTAGGRLIHYRTWGAASSSRGAILLVHGLGGSTYSYREIAPRLADQGYFVVAVDVPGFGYSTRDRRTSFESDTLIDDLWHLLDRTGRRTDWSLVGHSMGARTVTAMADRYGDRTARLVLIDPAFDIGGPFAFLVRIPPGRWILRWRLESRILTYDGVRELLAAAYGRSPTDAEVRSHLEPLLIDGTVPALAALARNTGRFRLRPKSHPTLTIWGAADPYVDVSPLADAENVVIEGAAHCPMETHPEAALSALIRFLEANDN